ncbi:MAG: FIST C-terminal domain-containing protein [Candidatus Omnitrophica bacterium]|nr:FIST C-terminal domain-containing protein [Candidatus Omnitrophota bacterium]
MSAPMMRFGSGMSDAASAPEAADTAVRQALEPLAGLPPHLAVVFVSPIYRASWPDLLYRMREQMRPAALIGCSGSGIIGGGQELEWVPAISIMAAHLPQVRVFPFTITPQELEDSSVGGFWIDKIGAAPEAKPNILLFADPLTIPADKLLDELNATYRNRPISGGMVSGGNEPGEHVLFSGDAVMREGAVGVALTGSVSMDTVISQGCRPIGRPFIVTKAEEHVIWQLGGRQALAALHEVLSALPVGDRELAQQGSVFAGLAMTEMRQQFVSGDFLIRNIVGIDPETGAIAVADQIEVGQTLQFQLRDPSASRQELRRLLCQRGEAATLSPAAGCLLFCCTGRGKALYGMPHQDVRTIQTISGKIPIGGFFCNGEIGPIGGTNFLHSYTASLALFRPLAKPIPHRESSTQAVA